MTSNYDETIRFHFIFRKCFEESLRENLQQLWSVVTQNRPSNKEKEDYGVFLFYFFLQMEASTQSFQRGFRQHYGSDLGTHEEALLSLAASPLLTRLAEQIIAPRPSTVLLQSEPGISGIATQACFVQACLFKEELTSQSVPFLTEHDWEPSTQAFQAFYDRLIARLADTETLSQAFLWVTILDAAGKEAEARREIVGVILSRLSLTRNKRLLQALKREHQGNLRDAMLHEVLASSHLYQSWNWSDFCTLHTRLTRELISALTPESSRLFALDPTTLVALQETTTTPPDFRAEFEAREMASYYASFLPTRQRAVFLQVVSGDNESDIAQSMGLSLGSVRQHKARFREKLRPLWIK